MATERLAWRLRWYRAALALSSAEFRLRFRDEAVGSLEMALASERERRGRVAAFWLWLRAMGDAARSTLRDRRASGGWTGGSASDVKLAFRGMRRSPQYAIVMIGTLALAIGGVAAVFMLADPMLFRALPYRDADRLVRVSVSGKGTFGGFIQTPDFDRIEAAGIFERVMTFDGPVIGRASDLSDDAGSLLGYRVTEGFFDTLGIGAQRGRIFSPAEYAGAQPHTAALKQWQGTPILITDSLWRRLGKREDIVGQSLALSSAETRVSLPIVGVLRPDFVLPDATNDSPSFLLPGHLDRVVEAGRPPSVVDMFARLRSGASAEVVTSQVQAVIDSVAKDDPAVPQARAAKLMDLRTLLFSRVRVALLMLLALTSCVLLLAIGNLTHLSLARYGERTREIAMRRALGASRLRIVRLLLAESTVLAGLAGVAALGLSRVLFNGVMAAVPRLAHIYRLMPAGLSLRVAAVIGLIVASSVIAIGFLPAISVSGRSLFGALQSFGNRLRGRRRRTDGPLTALQAALGASILVATMLLVGSFVRLTNAVTGIDENGLVTANLELPADFRTRPQDAFALIRDVRDAVQRETGQPIGLEGGIPGFTLPGGLWRSDADAKAPAVAVSFPVDPSAMAAFHLELRQGRWMTEEEGRSNAEVAVIDERTAELIAPGTSALGLALADSQVRGERTTRRVIGVVRRVDTTFGKAAAEGVAFTPFDPRRQNYPAVIWRGSSNPRLGAALRDAVRAREPRARIAVSAFVPFERRFGEPRLLASVIGVLGVLALLLTVTGVYSVTSHAVAGRTAEIGIRMALGATAGGVKRMIMRETLFPAMVGVAVGLFGASLWAQTIETLLFQVTAHDAGVYVGSAIAILVVVALAGAIPTARASRINPTEALRAD